MTYWKAVRTNGTDFHSGRVLWAVEPGTIVHHPTTKRGDDLSGHDADSYLSVSTVPTDCTGMAWPCRLLEVESVRGYPVITPDPEVLPNKRASAAWRVVGEHPAHFALGPQGEHVAALIEATGHLTDEQLSALNAARVAALVADKYAAKYAAKYATRTAAWDAARDAARIAALDAAWDAARIAAWDAVSALVVRDLITTGHYDALTMSWRRVIGRIHSDDPEVK